MGEKIFERNLKAMEKWYPKFAELLKRKDYETDHLEVIQETSWDREPIFKIKKEEQLLYLNGKRNAKEPIDIWMERLGNIHKYAPVFLLGLGNGLYLKKLIANTDQTVKVIAYEPSVSIFCKLLETVDLSSEIEDRPIGFIINGINEAEMDAIIGQVISLETLEYLKCEMHPNYRELFPEEILEISKKIKRASYGIFVRYNTGVTFSNDFVKNIMLNMKYVCDGYHTKGLSEAVPHQGAAILVAAGPSLDKNIQQLKKAKNRAFILAVDTALKPMIHAGILPDAYITIDPQKPVDLVELDVIKNIPVIAPPSANWDIIKEQTNKKIFYNGGNVILPVLAYLSVGEIMPQVDTGGSVACSGFSLLYKMGFETIILVGQDLAYTDNKSHADGTFKEEMPEEDVAGMIRVKGNYEKDLPTIYNLTIYLNWFEMYIKGIKNYNEKVRIINATAGGAYIEGTELMTLEEAIQENCKEEVDFGKCIEQMQPVLDDGKRKIFIKYLHTIPDEFEKIKKNARKLYSGYHKVNLMCRNGNVNQCDYLKQLKRIKKISEKCENSPIYSMISSTMYLADYMVISESLYELATVEEEGLEVSGKGMKYAKMLQQCCDILKKHAEETLLSIE